MANINDIEGVSPAHAALLMDIGIRTTDQLLELGATSTARMLLADQTHLSDETIKQWVHHADLLRIDGMTPAYAELLCRFEVCTVPKLAYRDVRLLHAALSEWNHREHAVDWVPSIAELEDFITQAKELPKVVHH